MRFLLFLLAAFVAVSAVAQFPGGAGNRGGAGARSFNVGHFYGKVVDAKTGKPVEFAAVQLMQNKMDSISGTMKESMVTGQLTEGNGDFSLEGLPVFGEFKLKIAALGYTPYEQKVSFNFKPG